MSPSGVDPLDLGRVSEEIRELIRRPLQTDEYRRAELQTNARTLELLTQISRNTGALPRDDVILEPGDNPPASGGGGGSTTGDSGTTTTGTSTATGSRQGSLYPQYYSTGTDPDVLTGGIWESYSFGFVAREVMVDHSDSVEITFEPPDEAENALIPSAGDATFTFGGTPPLNAPTVWVRRAPTATTDPQVTIIAY